MLGRDKDGKEVKFADKHPLINARGKFTVIQDYDTRYIDKGVVRFKDAEVEVNGKMVPIDDTNVHLFITNGASIYRARCYLDSPCLSGAWVSMPKKFTQMVIKRGGNIGDDDDAEIDESYVPANETVTKQVATEAPLDENTVIDILDEM